MNEGDEPTDADTPVTRVFATVHLQSSWRDRLPADGSVKAVNLAHEEPTHLALQVILSAATCGDRRIRSNGTDFGMSGPRVGIWHRWHGPQLPDDPAEAKRAVLEHRVDLNDITDGINQMLGRDPALHLPLGLSWNLLRSALDDAGVAVTEQDLIAAPLSVEISPEVQTEMDAPAST